MFTKECYLEFLFDCTSGAKGTIHGCSLFVCTSQAHAVYFTRIVASVTRCCCAVLWKSDIQGHGV